MVTIALAGDRNRGGNLISRESRVNKSLWWQGKRLGIYSYRLRNEERREEARRGEERRGAGGRAAQGWMRDKDEGARRRDASRKAEAAFLSSERRAGRASRSQMRHEPRDKGGKAAGQPGQGRAYTRIKGDQTR